MTLNTNEANISKENLLCDELLTVFFIKSKTQ